MKKEILNLRMILRSIPAKLAIKKLKEDNFQDINFVFESC